MRIANLKKIIKFLNQNYNSKISDIYYALELLLESVKQTKDILQESTGIDMEKIEYSKRLKAISDIQETMKYIDEIQTIENTLDSYLDLFLKNDIVKEIIAEDDNEDSEDEKVIPNYQDYQVNPDIPHLLTESFKNKKICGFMIDNIRYNADKWKIALKKICEILFEKNPKKFNSLVNNKNFQGRKIKLFSFSDNNNKYYIKLDNADIYVWTNRSANDICSTIRKLLIEYNIPINSLYIYLRADYTSLHNGTIDINIQENVDEEQIKIGKYVRTNMRNLSNNNYRFSQDMLNKLTDSTQTKIIFGTGFPFLKEVIGNANISELAKNSSGYYRYWLEIFEFNGRKFLINSQWTKNNSERFHKWFDSLPNKNI